MGSAPPALLLEAHDAVALAGRLGSLGVVVETSDDTEAAIEALRKGAGDAQQPAVLLVGPGWERPIAVARALHAAVPSAHIAFLARPDQLEALRHQLGRAPMVGPLWSLTAMDDPALAQRIADAAHQVAHRRQFRATLDRMNVRLAARAPVEGAEHRRLVLSERLLAEVLTHTGDAIVTLNPDGLVRDWNRSAESLFGRTTSEAVGRPLAEAATWSEDLARLLAERAAGEAMVRRRLRCETRAGVRHVELTLSPVRDDEGAGVGWVAIMRDVTEQSRVADALAADAVVLGRIAAGAPLAEVLDVLVRGAEARSTDGMMGSVLLLDEGTRTLRHGAAPSLPEAYRRAIDGVAVGPRVGSCGTAAYERREVRVTDIATDPLWTDFREIAAESGLAACSSSPVFASDGRVLGTVAMYYRAPRAPGAQDLELTRSAVRLAGIAIERHRAEERVHALLEAERAARAEAEEAGRMKEEFLATLSHELRTPLNAILGWSELLRQTSREPSKGLEVIERNARAQKRIIEDLLDMSAIVNGKLRLDVRPVDLAEVLGAALETVRPAAEARGVRLHALLDPRCGPVSGDPDRLQQVLWNLLSNAVKFTPRGGQVRAELARVDSHIEVRVVDTGEGITPEFLPHMFDRFRQADATMTRRHGGLGLGLAIAKQLVELHGGTIRVQSPGLGHGATFVVELPLSALRAASEQGSGRRHPTADTPTDPTDASPRLDGVRVLMVDDEADARDMVKALLERCHARVTTAGSAAEALSLLRAEPPDVLISDLGMPGEDGIALIRQVRALGPEEGGRVPAIALTAYAGSRDRVRIIRAGFQHHLAKPIEPAELIALVASAAGHAPVDPAKRST
ncbi:MAG: ATP-binding protein [Deltaproteobacteria bacterium]|nr:ATP-binding protein [Deltaproteobacteria bacterium]